GFYGQLRELAHPARFQQQLATLDRIKWVVYAKPPFGGRDQVLRYLARYTHRVAISNGRLLGLEEGRVRFRWRDSRDGNRIKEMSLDGVEFIRRFLLHVLPGGFVKIRHYGFLSNRNRKAMVEHCRSLLPPSPVVLTVVPTGGPRSGQAETGRFSRSLQEPGELGRGPKRRDRLQLLKRRRVGIGQAPECPRLERLMLRREIQVV